MEEEFIKQLNQDIKSSNFGSKQDSLQMWYNDVGDCIQFRTKHVATIGERIDDYLTLYRSVEDNKPIGFQLKDIHALIKDCDIDGMDIQAGYTSEDKSLSSISITELILVAFDKIPKSINRRFGYTNAFRTIVNDADRVEIPTTV